MTALLAVLVVIALVVLWAIAAIIKPLNVEETINVSTSARFVRTLSIWEEEEVKKYASIFSLDGEAYDMDTTTLLEMGRKYAAYFGEDKFEEIHAAIVQENIERYFHQDPESRSRHHRINMMISAHDLVAVVAPSFITINKSFGGDKDGEPTTISSYRAA